MTWYKNNLGHIIVHTWTRLTCLLIIAADARTAITGSTLAILESTDEDGFSTAISLDSIGTDDSPSDDMINDSVTVV